MSLARTAGRLAGLLARQGEAPLARAAQQTRGFAAGADGVERVNGKIWVTVGSPCSGRQRSAARRRCRACRCAALTPAPCLPLVSLIQKAAMDTMTA